MAVSTYIPNSKPQSTQWKPHPHSEITRATKPRNGRTTTARFAIRTGMDIALETLSPSGNVGSKTKAFANSLIFNFLFIDSDLYDVRISDRTPANDPATIMPLNH